MEPIYGIALLLLGLCVTFGFFWVWFKIQIPKKEDTSEGHEVLKRSKLLD